MQTPRWIAWGLVGVMLVTGTLAQQAPTDLATLRKNADRLTKELRRAKQEVTFSEESMLRLDTEVEAGIGALVDLIAKARDSLTTDGRVAACRASAVAGLRRGIALYVAEREQRRQNGWDTSRLDQRIDLRLEQMAKLAESHDPEQEMGKSTSLLDDMWIDSAVEGLKAGKYLGEEVSTREEMVKELESVVQFLTSHRDTLTLQLAVTTNPAEKEKIEQEIAHAESLADKRREQVAALLAVPAADQASMVGVGTASDIEKALRENRKVIRVKLMDLQKLATTRDYQQKRADYLAKQLAETQAAVQKLQNPE